MQRLAGKIYYTPRKALNLCTGVSAVNEPLKRGIPRFQVNVEGMQYRAEVRGEEGLKEIAVFLKEMGYSTPKDFGQSRDLKEFLNRVKVKTRSIEIRVPETAHTGVQRHSFQYRDTFGSFNNAMCSALSTLMHFKQLIDIIDETN